MANFHSGDIFNSGLYALNIKYLQKRKKWGNCWQPYFRVVKSTAIDNIDNKLIDNKLIIDENQYKKTIDACRKF